MPPSYPHWMALSFVSHTRPFPPPTLAGRLACGWTVVLGECKRPPLPPLRPNLGHPPLTLAGRLARGWAVVLGKADDVVEVPAGGRGKAGHQGAVLQGRHTYIHTSVMRRRGAATELPPSFLFVAPFPKSAWTYAPMSASELSPLPPLLFIFLRPLLLLRPLLTPPPHTCISAAPVVAPTMSLL